MFFKIIRQILFFFQILETDQIALLIWITNIPFLTIFERTTATTIPWLKNWKNIIYSSYQTASEFFRYSFRATLFSPLMNACDFVFQNYEIFWSLLLDHYIKHKPLISEEWVHITHPNTFLYFTTTDGQIFLSCHNQKLMKEKKKTIFFFQTYSLSFFLIFCTIAVYICHSDQKGCHGFCLIARMECKVKFLKSFVWLWTPLCYTTVGSPCKYNKYHKASTLYSLQIRVEFACNTK